MIQHHNQQHNHQLNSQLTLLKSQLILHNSQLTLHNSQLVQQVLLSQQLLAHKNLFKITITAILILNAVPRTDVVMEMAGALKTLQIAINLVAMILNVALI